MQKKGGIIGGFLLPHPPVAVPEVGGGREKEAAETLTSYEYAARETESLAPETIVVVSPHAPLFRDYLFIYDGDTLAGNFAQFGAPEPNFRFEQDGGLREEIARSLKERGIPGGGLSRHELSRFGLDGSLDHGVLVPMYYAASKYKSAKIVAMSCSGLDFQKIYEAGRVIRDAAEKTGRRALFIASGDMSHKAGAESPYGECPEGARFDAMIARAFDSGSVSEILSIDPEVREAAAECGYRSVIMMCGAFDGTRPDVKLLSMEAPFGIGYCAASFMPSATAAPCAFKEAYGMDGKRKGESEYVQIARETLEMFVKTRRAPAPSYFEKKFGNMAGLFVRSAGTFVSIKKCGELRGCIGTTSPQYANVADEIIHNSVSAGMRDPRFPSVLENELSYLQYSVDVLSESVPVIGRDGLDPSKYGVIVEKGERRGLLLPALEGVKTVDSQLKIACRKAGIGEHEKYSIRKFTVERHK